MIFALQKRSLLLAYNKLLSPPPSFFSPKDKNFVIILQYIYYIML